MSIYQYAKTTDPEVLAAVAQNDEKYAEFKQKARALSEKYTGGPGGVMYRGNAQDGAAVAGIVPTDKPLPGEWKKPGRHGLRLPYKSNPAYQDFRIGTRAVPIPGRPSIIFGKPDSEGTSWMSHGAIFEHDGAVYSGVNFAPDQRRDTINGVTSTMDDHGWVEIKASEFDAALSAR